MPAPRIAALLGLLALAACEAAPARHSTGTGITLVDDVGRSVHLAAPARRIVSLKPSITETLVLMGAGDRIVGRSTADDHPAVQDLPSIGDALDPNMEALASLRPDLVLIWESTTPSVRERIEALGIPTFAVQSHDTAQIFRSFHSVGQLTGMSAAADSLAGTVRGELAEVAASVRDLPRPTTFVVEWNDPPMTAGPDSYLGQLVSVAGGEQ